MRNSLFFSFFFVLLSTVTKGQDVKMEANYIYNISKYVNWPADYKTGDFVIGVLGPSGITLELTKIAATKKFFSQKISIMEFTSVSDIKNCHILFVTKMASGTIKEAVAKIGTNATLVVSEFPGLANYGAAINFIMKDGKMVFQYNEAAAKRQGLQVNSRLVDLSIE